MYSTEAMRNELSVSPFTPDATIHDVMDRLHDVDANVLLGFALDCAFSPTALRELESAGSEAPASSALSLIGDLAEKIRLRDF